MKTFYRIILIFLPIILLASFLLKVYRPELKQGELVGSVLFGRLNLPLREMFNLKSTDDKFLVAAEEKGFIVSGPYEALFRGRYTANFTIIPACQDQEVGYIDIVRYKGTKAYAHQEIVAANIGQTQTESLSADLPTGADYEFRLYSNGKCAFEIKEAWIEK